MATPINAPKAGEIWHLSIEDLFAPVEAAPRLGGDGPFVINLSVSTAPISVPTKAFAACADAHVYQIQVTEDGRMRYRLRLGPFSSEDEADAILAEVREIYPGALTATAGAADLRTIGSLQAKIDSRKSNARKAPESPAQKKTEAHAQKALDGVAAEISIDFVLPTSVLVPAPAAPRAAPAAPRAAPAAPRAAPAQHRAAPMPQRPAPPATPLAAPEPSPPPPAALPPLDLDPEWALPVLERRAVPAPAAKVAVASPAPSPPPAANRAPKAAPIPAAKSVPVLTEQATPKVEVPVLKPEIFNAVADAPVLTEVVAPVLQTVAPVRTPVRIQVEAPAPQAAPKEQMAVLVSEILGAVPEVAPVPAQVSAPVAKATAPQATAPQATAPQAAPAPPAVPKPAPPIAGASLATELAHAIAQTPKLPPLKMHTPVQSPKVQSPKVQSPKAHTPKVHAPKVHTPKAPAPMAAKPAPVLTQSIAPTHKALVSKILARAVKSSKLTSLQHVVVASARVPAARDVKQLSDPLDNLESTQTVRALSPVELEDEEASRWFVIELAVADRPYDPDAVPNLDIFSEYRLYSVAGVDHGRTVHALRLGFFSEEIGAVAVASYLAAHYDKPSIKRVSIAERERFAHQRVEARKDVAETGTHAAIEITDELVARRKRTTKPASKTEQSDNAGLPWNSLFPVR